MVEKHVSRGLQLSSSKGKAVNQKLRLGSGQEMGPLRESLQSIHAADEKAAKVAAISHLKPKVPKRNAAEDQVEDEEGSEGLEGAGDGLQGKLSSIVSLPIQNTGKSRTVDSSSGGDDHADLNLKKRKKHKKRHDA